MGKRKSSTKKPAKKPKRAQPKTFECIICRADDAVTITLERKDLLGNLKCRVCGEKFQAKLTGLDEAVDVYAYWNDEYQERKERGEVQ